MAIIGEQLLQPEAGWKRYDDRSKYFFATRYELLTGGTYYNDTVTQLNPNSKLTIKFTGSRIRVIGYHSTTQGIATFVIDNTLIGTYNCDASPVGTQRLIFEMTELSNEEHIIIIENNSLRVIQIDAIDIDESGTLLYPYLTEKTKISEMEIGDVISCEYVAASNTVGTFSNLGNATKALIPPSSSATPNGSFYFIKVDENLLIADRVVQHSISWDKLNAGKMIEGLAAINTISPILTSNNQNGYIASASTVYNSTYEAWKAFDGLTAQEGSYANRWITAQGYTSGWVSLEYPTPVIINSYKLTSNYVPLAAPKSWYFEGSNDGIEWQLLHTGNAEIALNAELFVFQNNQAYKYYRIYILDNQGYSDFLAIDELTMYYNPFYLIRSLFGGCAYIDANSLLSGTNQNLGGFPNLNEWDRYIVNSDLNGKITKEDPNIWNHHRNIDTANGVPLSWCQDSMYNVAANRITRGRFTQAASSLNYSNLINNIISTTVNNINGFRPVLQLIDDKQANFWR